MFIPLDDRVAQAQAHGAALFVSMHADALSDHSVRGASVYTLADTASDAQTAALAQRENSADRFAGPAIPNAPPEVAHILASLVRRETRLRLRPAGAQHGRPSGPRPADAAKPGAACRIRRAEGGRHPERAGGNGLHVESGRTRRSYAARQHRARVAEAMKRAVDGYFAAGQRRGR